MKRSRLVITLTLGLGLTLALALFATSSQATPTARPLSRPMDPITDPMGNTHIAFMPSPNSAQIFTATLNVRAYIDGRSRLLVQGDTVHWHHLEWTAPGRPDGANEPTYLNGGAWYPTWPDIPNPENRNCDCDSSTYVGIPPLAMQDQSASLDIVQARDSVTIIQQPNAVNGYTLIVEVNDLSGGADWYEIDIDYISYYAVNLTPPTQAGSGEAGSTVTYTVRLANQTGVSDSFSLTLGSHVWDTALSADSLGPVAHGDSLTFTVHVTIPVDAAWYLTDTVVVTATSVTSPTIYSDTARLTTQAYAPPQISVSPNVLTNTQYVNKIVTGLMTISNGNGVTLTFNLASASVPGAATLYFDGIDDQLNMDTSNVLMLTDTDFTIEAWISTTQTTDGYVLGKHDPGWWNGYLVSINNVAPNKVSFYTAQGPGEAISTSDVNDGRWHHIAAVYYVSGTKQLYVDGVLEDSKSAPVHIPSNTASFHVGYLSESWPDHDYFQGQVDEVRVWSVVRTQAEIQSAKNTPLIGNEPGLVGYWRLEESSGQIAYDNTVNGNDGQLGSTPGVDDSDPSWCLAPSGALPFWLTTDPLSGTVGTNSSQIISVTFNSTGLQPGTYMTKIGIQSNDPAKPLTSIPVTMTVNPTASMGWVEGTVTDVVTGAPLTATITALGQPYTITTKPDGSYKLWLEAGSYTLRAAAAGYVTQTAMVSITVQQGITRNFALELNVPRLSVSPGSLEVTHYVGDISTRTLTITNNGPAPLTFYLAIGMPSNGLVAYYPFNGNANDESGNGNDGTVVGATLTTDRFGNPDSAYSFDGGDDYIRVPDDNSLDLSDGLTIIAWIKSDDTSGGRVIISKWNDTTGDHSYIFKDWDSSDRLSIELRDNNEGVFASLRSATPITTSEWILVATTFDSNTVKLYLDCAEDASSTATGIIKNSATDLLVGAVFTSGGIYQHFDGVIDDVRIYNRALTTEEILALYCWQGSNDVTWLSTTPVSGTVPGNNSVPVQVTFNATGMQPGDHTADIVVQSNDPFTPSVAVPVTMTVNATANMGRVTGFVSDAWLGLPLTATVELIGVYSLTASPNYTIWAASGAYSLTAYAPGYFTITRPVSITAGGLVNANLALEPAQPRLEWAPIVITRTAGTGSKVTHTLLISNTGPVSLEIALHEISPTLALGFDLSTQPAQSDIRHSTTIVSGTRILYDRAHGEPGTWDYSTLVNDAIGAGAVVSESYSVIDASVLAGYDVLWVNCCGGTAWSFGELNAVNDWLSQGGAVFVQGESSNATTSPAGIFNITYQSGNCTSGTTTNISDHPISKGVSAVNVEGTCWRLATGSGADIVVYDLQSQPHIVAQEQSGGKMVVVASEDFTNGYIGNNDNYLLANNILAWLARPSYGDVSWLSEAPITATIPGHSSLPVAVEFDATALAPGTYRATLAVEHNDPARSSPVEIPVTLTVLLYRIYLPLVLRS